MRQVPRKILIGITGSIAAYKSVELTRLLMKAGHDVKIVMTKSSQQFIGKATFEGIIGHKVFDDCFDAPMAHIDLARWADHILIAPGSANFIAKLCAGLCDDLLSTICLAAKIPISIVPTMNQYMWQNPATQSNIDVLKGRGFKLIGPASGEQACGDFGVGRMLEPIEIIAKLSSQKQDTQKSLVGKHILITAGPTHEPLDPVRYIGSRSSGKMGYALAEAAVDQGAQVTLVSGPTALRTPEGVNLIAIKTAQEMLDVVMAKIKKMDVFISAAAVSDYRPQNASLQKIKKSDAPLCFELEQTADILLMVSQLPKRPFLIGFAAETDNVLSHAKGKLKNKQLDMIVANQVTEHQPFGTEHNEVWILQKNNPVPKHIPESLKRDIAGGIIQMLAEI